MKKALGFGLGIGVGFVIFDYLFKDEINWARSIGVAVIVVVMYLVRQKIKN